MRLAAIGFDADDTLWHNEPIFAMTEQQFEELLSAYCPVEEIRRRLFEIETRNLHHFGYGVKGFVLSMIETAIELTGGHITGAEIQHLIDWGRQMLESPIELLPHVETVLHSLAVHYPLLLITKGDLLDQESKIARSGLADLFTHIEIVVEKTPQVYARILARHHIPPEQFLMVGNSLRSDVLPVRTIGGLAVHIPYRITWPHEVVSAEGITYFTLDHIGELPAFVRRLERGEVEDL
ncbi:MAG: HAD family hydrolase [Ardenticatenia bacterium]|nr:HAD family hydrolase [Ardenticatenia bacterium]